MSITGFFNSITGGAADISLKLDDAKRGGKIPVAVNVTVMSEAINPSRVYIEVRGSENIAIQDYKLPDEKDAKGQVVPGSGKSIDVKHENNVYQKEFTLTQGQALEARSHHTFTGEIELPADAPPTCAGKCATISWQARAGLDMRGNDPNSPWQTIKVS